MTSGTVAPGGNGDRAQGPPIHAHVTARGCERRVRWRQIVKIDEAMPLLRDEGFHLVALEMTAEAQVFTEYEYPGKVCLVLGSEGREVLPPLPTQQ